MEESHEPSLETGSPHKHAPPPRPPPPPPLPLLPLSSNPPPHKSAAAPEQLTKRTIQLPGATNSSPFKPVYYFFYGTLMKPHILQGVLGLDSEPATLRTAKIYDYELTDWGQYRMLVDNPGSVVNGCAYWVESAEDAYKLGYYEPNAYVLTSCKIHFTDESDSPLVEGKTFKYAGDAAALKEGRFDRTLWERQMGQKWPLRRQKGEECGTGKDGTGTAALNQTPGNTDGLDV